jgi:hypothetical protein
VKVVENNALKLRSGSKRFEAGHVHPERIKNAAVLAAVKARPLGVRVGGNRLRAGRP